MNLGVRSKLLFVSLGLIAISLLMADLFLTRALDRQLTQRIQEDLLVRATMAERAASSPATKAPNFQATWEPLAIELGHRSQARVTIIRSDGHVLGDSNVASDAVEHMENHLDRPEVSEALSRRQGACIRYSATLGQRMMYVAVPFSRGASTAGVVRLAVPLAQVDHAVGSLRKVLAVASLAALAFAVLLSSIAAHWISKTLRELTHVAGSMVGGNLATRSRTSGHDEIAALGHSLDKMAQDLATALDELGSERDLLSGILAGMQEGVLVLSREGRVVHLNPALCDMLLLGRDTIGKSLLEVIRNAGLAALLASARASGESASGEIELTGLKPRRLLTRISALPGKPGNLLVVLVDVTDLRRLESVRKDFVANASHELRTPVASIRSSAETLRNALQDPSAAESFVEIIERNAKRLQALLDDLLDLSRIESRQFHLESQPVEISPVVDQLLGLHRPAAAAKQIRLTPEIPSDLEIQGDRRGLEHILGNLLDNAVKYCPEDSEIRITANIQGSRIQIAVTDNGPGIEAQHLPRLFERFYRADAGRSRELGGTGLGLAIAKNLAEAMGGSLAVDSELGRGTTFTLFLHRAVF